MSRNIMVPVDGSRFSETALRNALGIAGPDDSILLVTVVESAPPFSIPQYNAIAREWAEKYLSELAERIGSVQPKIATEILVGSPGAGLNERAAKDIDLVVMATHGRGPISRAWIGSVADALVRGCRAPVLLVHPGKEEEEGFEPLGAPRKVLVPLDGSDLAESILGHVQDVTGGKDVTYTLLRIVQYPYTIVSPYLPDTIHDNQEIFRQAIGAAKDYLTELSWKLRNKGIQVETEVHVAEHPARAIVEFARDHEMDLIAIATHGRGGLSRLALGSVTDKIVRTSETPVLVFRPAETPKEQPDTRTGVEFVSL